MDDIEIICVKPKGSYRSADSEKDGGKIIYSCKRRFAKNRANYTEYDGVEVLSLLEDVDVRVHCVKTADKTHKEPRIKKIEEVTITDDWLLEEPEEPEPEKVEIPTHMYGKAGHMMRRMGWTGRALRKEGMLLPLMPTIADSQKRRQGFGFKDPLRKKYPFKSRNFHKIRR